MDSEGGDSLRSGSRQAGISQVYVQLGKKFMALRDSFELAKERGEGLKRSFPHALSAHYDRTSGRVVVELSSKLAVSFSPRDAQGLEHARPSQLEPIEISPSGFGLHFPKLDADLYVPALLEGFLGSQRWMAARLGEIGGQSRSPAKKAASRANGKFGGRPRKQAKSVGS
jgi:hypothetical protein